MKTSISIPALLLAGVLLASCDSGNPGDNNSGFGTFNVRYEASGTCDGIIGPNALTASYTVAGGGIEAKTVTAPWSQTFSITSSPTLTVVGFTVICSGSGTASNTITAEIFIDGDSKARTTDSGTGTVLINANASL